jgi:hypothetical protein
MYKRTIFNQDGKLQKRAARIILNATTETPSAVMFKKLEWLTIYNRIDYFRAVMMYITIIIKFKTIRR